ncbi:MAG: HNH endonuclease signature motif containing protein [Bacteroidales bacterium]|jgi:hypothetical protein
MWIKKNKLKLADICVLLNQYKCQYCSSEIALTIDHVIPLHKNGFDHISNFQILCKRCNSDKSCNLKNDYIPVIRIKDFLEMTRRNTNKYSEFSYNYFCQVISNYFGVDNIVLLEYHCVSIRELSNLKEYLNAYGMRNYGLLDIINSHELKIKNVHLESKFVLKYNPVFMLSDEFNMELINSLVNYDSLE